jgi:hypothetical protein
MAADYPIDSNLNIMYTFHFYACDHMTAFNDYLKTYSSQIPIFATEWSITKADGATNICYDNATEFTNYCRDNRISWCAWSWSAKSEKSAALSSAPYDASWIYAESNLREAGRFVKDKLQETLSSSLTEVKNILFGIHPNPSKDGLFNIFLENNGLTTLTISNTQGKTVYSSTLEERESTINTNLKAGVYIVTIKNDDGIGTQKLVVE